MFILGKNKTVMFQSCSKKDAALWLFFSDSIVYFDAADRQQACIVKT